MSKFQIILLTVFGLFIILAVAVFALYRGGASSAVTVTVWGDISTRDFSVLLNSPNFSQNQPGTIQYVEKSAATIETEFTEALARGTGPDLIILTQDKIWKERSKLIPIPFNSYSQRDFQSSFIEEAELFMDANGIYALPVTVDPLVLYYNRDLLSAAGHARPIEYWDEIYAAALNLSKRNAGGSLIASVMALGEASNIPNYKEVLSLLMLQAGTPITGYVGTNLRSQIAERFNYSVPPGESSLDFYTQFSNPTRAFYSWNRSLIDAQTHFASGDSAYYIGFASELRAIRNKNPTLNFGVSHVPQSRVAGRMITYGTVRGVGISRGSANPAAAFAVALQLSSAEGTRVLAQELLLPPPRRDLLSVRPTDAIISVFYDAALQSRGWIDPDTRVTKAIFAEAIESVTSGRARTAEAVARMNREVDGLITR